MSQNFIFHWRPKILFILKWISKNYNLKFLIFIISKVNFSLFIPKKSSSHARELRSAGFIFIMLHKIWLHLLLGRGTCPDSGSSSTCPCRLVNTVLKLYFSYQNDLSRFSILNKIVKQYFQILVPNTLNFLLVLRKYLQVFLDKILSRGRMLSIVIHKLWAMVAQAKSSWS